MVTGMEEGSDCSGLCMWPEKIKAPAYPFSFISLLFLVSVLHSNLAELLTVSQTRLIFSVLFTLFSLSLKCLAPPSLPSFIEKVHTSFKISLEIPYLWRFPWPPTQTGWVPSICHSSVVNLCLHITTTFVPVSLLSCEHHQIRDWVSGFIHQDLLRTTACEFLSQFNRLLVTWPWSYFKCLCCHFIICSMKIMKGTATGSSWWSNKK